MTISSSTAAPITYLPPSSTDAPMKAEDCEASGMMPMVGGDAGAGAAAIGGGGVLGNAQQALVDALQQALTVLQQLVTKLGGSASTAVGGASGGGAVSQDFPTQSTPTQTPDQSPEQSPTQSPTQSPMQSPTQSAPNKMFNGSTLGGGSTVGGGPQGDVVLSEGGADHAVNLTSPNGNSLRMWGDPHIDATINGQHEKFDIGYGPGSVTLNDGTRINWDTAERNHVVNNFQIDRPAGVAGDVTVNAGDDTLVQGVRTGLTDSQMSEFLTALRSYNGQHTRPLSQH